MEPDWVFDTGRGEYSGRCLWRRPRFQLKVHQVGWGYWPLFVPHYYLSLPKMIAATCYVGTVDGDLVAHRDASTRPGLKEARASRLVVMPEWQKAGVGLRFLNAVCDLCADGRNRYEKPMPTLIHTSHSGLCLGLRRDRKWVQLSAELFPGNKRKSSETLKKSGCRSNGYGGHFRAIQGFRYLGEGWP